MKYEMAMLDNGNYEKIISPIQHCCKSQNYAWTCVEYGYQLGKLFLQIEDGDPYEEGFSSEIEVMCCPFCGYKAQDTQ